MLADQRVERRKRFIKQPDIRFDRERPGNSYALLLPAGQLFRKIVFASVQPYKLDYPLGLRIPILLAGSLHFERKCDIVDHAEMRHQSEALEHHAHLVAPDFDQLRVGLSQQILPVQQNVPGRGLHQTGQAAHDG